MTGLSTNAFQTAIQHLAEASKSANALIQPNISADMQAALLAINSQIAQAQSSSIAAQQLHSSALDRVRELEGQVAKMKDRSKECARYTTDQTDTGVTVYVLKSEKKAGQITHQACPNCFGEGKVRLLAPTHETKYWSSRELHFRVHECASCNAKFEYDGVASRRAPVVRNRDNSGWRI